jgi:hypothetical protein
VQDATPARLLILLLDTFNCVSCGSSASGFKLHSSLCIKFNACERRKCAAV